MSEKDPILDAIGGLSKKLDGDQEKTAKELKALADDMAKKDAEHAAEVKKINEDLAAAGATVGQLQAEVKDLLAKKISGGMGQKAETFYDIMSKAIADNKDQIIKSYDQGKLIAPIEMKVVGPVLSANLTGTGNNYISYLDWRPGMEPIGQYHFRDIVGTVQSDTDFVRFPRANVPIGEGSFGFTAEGSTKPQVDRDYTMIDLTLQALAAYIIVSRQSLRNITYLQTWLPTSLREQLMDQEDLEFGNTLVAAATGSTSTTGYTDTTNVGKMIAYIANLRKAKYNPTAVAAAPEAWANFLTNTVSGAGYNLPNVVTIDPTGNIRFLGIPILPVNWLTGGRILGGDFSKAKIVQSEGLVLRQSDSHASIFTANEIAFLLEVTEGLAVYRPAAFFTAVLS